MRNRRVGMRSIVAAFVLVVLPSATAAQTDLFSITPGPRRVDISGSGGFLLSTDWSDLVLLGSVSPVSGALEQVLVRDLVMEPGPVYDGMVTYWEGRYGFRVHAGYAQSCLAVGGVCGDSALSRPADSVDLNAWMYDVGGAIGLLDFRRGAPIFPYVYFGIGGVTYDLDRTVGPPLSFIERRPPRAPGDDVIIVTRGDPDQLLIAIDELGLETKLAFNIGIGTDFRVPLGPASVGIRLEVGDNIHSSPIDLSVVDIERFVPAGTQLDFGFVHNLRAAAGLVISFGQ
ncbi:MAG TPA: hypothetical protein VIX63_10920 [Vicinamibacterales bacterium]